MASRCSTNTQPPREGVGVGVEVGTGVGAGLGVGVGNGVGVGVSTGVSVGAASVVALILAATVASMLGVGADVWVGATVGVGVGVGPGASGTVVGGTCWVQAASASRTSSTNHSCCNFQYVSIQRPPRGEARSLATEPDTHTRPLGGRLPP